MLFIAKLMCGIALLMLCRVDGVGCGGQLADLSELLGITGKVVWRRSTPLIASNIGVLTFRVQRSWDINLPLEESACIQEALKSSKFSAFKMKDLFVSWVS